MRKHLITSALPYINGVKHIGNLVGSMLPADVYARFLRQNSGEVLFICGTDEHGTPAEIAAEEAGKDVREYCDEMYETQKSIYEKFGLSFDYFGRSSAGSNKEITNEIFLALWNNGYIIEKSIRQYYSIDDGRFLPDRYLEGTCPVCKYSRARGDQCDGCGALLNPEELIDPVSAISKSKNIELRETKHLFLDLSKIEGKVDEWVSLHDKWPDVVKGIAKKWINEGLKSRCITRDLKWGINVSLYEYSDKVFYVWFDAPNAYIGITKDWSESVGRPEEWKEWWTPCDEKKVSYTQFMAKDNVPFHAIFWPAMLFAANLGFKQVDYIKGFNWLTYDKGKFSTSQKRGIFTDSALKMFDPDYWRYYLIANCPEGDDSDFSFSHFASIINKDLCDVLGNFATRVLALLEKHFDSAIAVDLREKGNIDEHLLKNVCKHVDEIEENLDSMRFRKAASSMRAFWALGNEYISEKKPWNEVKQNKCASAVCLAHCVHLLRAFAITAHPVIPFSCRNILKILNDVGGEKNIDRLSFDEAKNFQYFKPDHKVGAPQRLFEKIEDDRVKELTLEFDGRC
ncbi:methionine--tRNA ligase [Candidatus Hydrogenosomobacter endosymbioticus]|nr:methionine--tRNA ligase [Candidatus Hydrogenosomobacter endosymbioticus]